MLAGSKISLLGKECQGALHAGIEVSTTCGSGWVVAAARQVILKWKDVDRIEDRLSEYWRVYPGGSDVVKNWKELARD